jgi:hypothetical protein
MARAMSANGKYKEAMKYLESALPQSPQESNKITIQNMMEQLKQGKDINK